MNNIDELRAAYIPGLSAKDYAPIHKMPILVEKFEKIVIMLAIFSPNASREENRFEWIFIETEDSKVIKELYEPFLLIPESLQTINEDTNMDEVYLAQTLPSEERMQTEIEKQLMLYIMENLSL